MNTSKIPYKQLHESFMENHNGTSIWENYSIIAPAPILVYFIGLIHFNMFGQYKNKLLIFSVEFLLMVCFICLQLTLLSDHIHIIACFLITAYIVSVKQHLKKFSFLQLLNKPRTRSKLRPYFTYFRSIVSIISCICILAVDFRIFPRRFAKTETFGYGLMDTGVGFYVFANGLVMKTNSKKNTLANSLLSSLPIIILGIIRTISVDTLNYQKHVSEYGIHWNFFFTLALVKIATGFLMRKFPLHVTTLTLHLVMIHQLILYVVFEDWVLEDSLRTDFISANKEGIVSLLGYITLYLCGVTVGKFLTFMNTVQLFDDFRHGLNCFLWSIIFLVITLVFQTIFNISRRLANITYLTWITSMSLFGLSLSIFSEMALRIIFAQNVEEDELYVPSIFQAINYNSLFYFLISNLFTGLINFMFHTLYLDVMSSIFILISYQFCACSITYLLFLYEIKIKFWYFFSLYIYLPLKIRNNLLKIYSLIYINFLGKHKFYFFDEKEQYAVIITAYK